MSEKAAAPHGYVREADFEAMKDVLVHAIKEIESRGLKGGPPGQHADCLTLPDSTVAALPEIAKNGSLFLEGDIQGMRKCKLCGDDVAWAENPLKNWTSHCTSRDRHPSRYKKSPASSSASSSAAVGKSSIMSFIPAIPGPVASGGVKKDRQWVGLLLDPLGVPQRPRRWSEGWGRGGPLSDRWRRGGGGGGKEERGERGGRGREGVNFRLITFLASISLMRIP